MGVRGWGAKLATLTDQGPTASPPSLRPSTILHICDARRASPYFSALATRIDRRRFTPVMGSLHSPSEFQESIRTSGSQTFALSCDTRAMLPTAVARLARLARSTKAALIHAHGFDATCVGLLAARVAKVPFLLTRHHSDHHVRIGARWHVMIDGWCARRATRVIAVSEATRRVLTDVEGVPLRKIDVVYNGVELGPGPEQRRVDAVRSELGIGAETVFLVMARLHEEKGHRFLLDALPEVVKQCGPLTVLLAGEGPERRNLEQQIHGLGLGPTVRLLGWRSDTRELIALSHVVVLTSLAESFGQAVTEAMSGSRPVVAFATGGIPEIVVHGETGILVPTGDRDALAAALVRVVQDPEEAHRMGQAGRKRSELFSYHSMVRGYEAVYASVLGPGPA